MRHMDEGLLQAWLDGPRAGLTDEERVAVEAHLADCPVCTERVETLRGTSDRVRDLMAAVDEPDEEIPPFDAVLRRAGKLPGPSGASAPTPARPWWGRRTAWAASILMALGAGWLANEWNTATPDIRLDPLQVREAPASFEAAEEAAASPDGAQRPSGVPLRNHRTEPLDRAAGAEAPAPVAEAPPAGDAARSPADASGTRAVEESRLAPRPAEPDPVARLSVTPVPQGDRDVPTSLVVAPSVPMELAGDRWTPASMEEARGHIGGGVATVPNLPIIGVHVGEFESVRAVRVEQVLDGGSPLILVQSGVPVRIAPVDTGSVASVVVDNRVFLAGWAELSVDSLRAVLNRAASN